MRRHHELLAWKLGIQLVKDVYALTNDFPDTERYGLVAQMRRAAVSVPSNIAEGAARESAREFAHFLVIARGSLSELETQMIIGKELGFFTNEQGIDELLNRVFGLIGGLLKSLRADKA